MDEDLADLDREALVAEVKSLRDGMRQHCASSDHDLCWYHPELWNLLPENTDSRPTVPHGHDSCAAVGNIANRSIDNASVGQTAERCRAAHRTATSCSGGPGDDVNLWAPGNGSEVFGGALGLVVIGRRFTIPAQAAAALKLLA
jgi:hypothetical protein